MDPWERDLLDRYDAAERHSRHCPVSGCRAPQEMKRIDTTLLNLRDRRREYEGRTT